MKRKVVLLTLSIALMLLVIWTVWGNITVAATHYSVASSRIPTSFDQYRIAAVSDVHNTELGENNSHLLALVEKEEPDIIVITGDLIDFGKTDIEIATNLVEKLLKIAPCYYVTGNHEAWLGAQYQALEKKLLDIGVVILHDEAVQLTRNDKTIQLAGLDDPDFADRNSSVHESMLETKLDNMNLTADYCILLSHRPETFNAYVSQNIDLALSGHAHGGQFRLPFIGGVIAPNQGLLPQYDSGKYTQKNTTMIVSRGIGNSIIPVRFNNRPEIVVVELIYDKSP